MSQEARARTASSRSMNPSLKIFLSQTRASFLRRYVAHVDAPGSALCSRHCVLLCSSPEVAFSDDLEGVPRWLMGVWLGCGLRMAVFPVLVATYNAYAAARSLFHSNACVARRLSMQVLVNSSSSCRGINTRRMSSKFYSYTRTPIPQFWSNFYAYRPTRSLDILLFVVVANVVGQRRRVIGDQAPLGLRSSVLAPVELGAFSTCSCSSVSALRGRHNSFLHRPPQS